MVYLVKLGILGIRSFSHLEVETLKFTKPLTLVVGHNGAGKTTIVECLRMATTGEVPPNANKGQNFLHDPRLLGLCDIKGQIRLVFTTSNKTQVATVRNFQLTCTEDKRSLGGCKSSFKAVDAVVQLRDSEGNIKSTSNKCVDINTTVASFLKVPKAVLDNVIFCHQEESCWPLSDAATLKKKFDELFGSNRYTKTLEVINNLRKKYSKDTKDKKHEFDLIARDAVAFSQLEEKINQVAKDIQYMSTSITDVSSHLEAEECIFDSVKRQAEEIQHEVQHITYISREIESLDKNIQVLTTQIGAFDQNKENHLYSEVEIQSLKSSVEEKTYKISSLQSTQENLQSEMNNLLDLKRRITNQYQQRAELEAKLQLLENEALSINQEIKDMGITDTSPHAIKQWVIERQRHHWDRMITSTENTLKELSNMENSVMKSLDDATNALDSNRAELAQLKWKLSKVIDTEKEIALKEEEIKQNNRSISELESQLNDTSDLSIIQHKIEELEMQKAGFSNQLDETNAAIEAAETNQVIFEELNVKQAALNAINEKIESFLKQIPELDRDITPNSVHEKLSSASKQLDHSKQNLECLHEKLESSNLEKGMYKACLENLQAKIDEISAEMDTDSICLEMYMTESDKLEESLKCCQSEYYTLQSAASVYKGIYEFSVTECKCRICLRTFEESELERFSVQMENKIADMPAKVHTALEHLKAAELKLKNHRILETKISSSELTGKKLAELYDELPELDTKLATVNNTIEHLKSEIQNTEFALAQLRSKHAILSTLNVLALEKFDAESVFLQVREKLQPDCCVGQKRCRTSNVNSTNIPLPELRNLSKNLRFKIEKLIKTQHQLYGECSKLESMNDKLHNLRDQVARDEQNLKDIANMDTSVDLEEKQEHLLKTICENQERVQGLRQQLKKIEVNSQSTENAIGKLHEERRNETAALESHIRNLNTKKQACRIIQEQLMSMRNASAMSELECKIAEVTRRSSSVNDDFTKLKLEIDASKICLRKHEQYVNVWELQKKREEFVQQLNQVKHKLSMRNYDALKSELADRKRRMDELKTTLNMSKGKLASKQELLESYQKECEHQKFLDVKKKTQIAKVNYVVANTVEQDLKRYHVALDNAVMNYHADKIKEVNSIIKDLWKEVYAGTDIDTIYIKSNTDNDTDNKNFQGRSYNYRVCMRRNDVELEMRGRCSAGQRVIAGIVIRLGLAEAFAAHCGILTLDEPTTNLDRRNIESLAAALVKLIDARKNDEAFQLILITHDEEFVEMLRQMGAADYFYQVRIDPKTGFSRIFQVKSGV